MMTDFKGFLDRETENILCAETVAEAHIFTASRTFRLLLNERHWIVTATEGLGHSRFLDKCVGGLLDETPQQSLGEVMA
jgi:hypothetical protein